MSIRQKLILLLAGTIAIFAGLALTLLTQMDRALQGYNAVLDRPVRQMELARVVQVTFKKQVQEWKDILLRGQNPEDLQRYTQAFHARENDVREQAVALEAEVQDPDVQGLLKQFVQAHQAMGVKYQAAYAAYVQKFDAKLADGMVRGQDRVPTDLFDLVVQRLGDGAKASIQAQRQSSERNIRAAMVLCGALLAGLCLFASVTVRSVLGRLRKLNAVADRLAMADVDGLAIDVSGDDEIGRFGESMKGVHAAIEELLIAHPIL